MGNVMKWGSVHGNPHVSQKFQMELKINGNTARDVTNICWVKTNT
jgi:hypothetical protein